MNSIIRPGIAAVQYLGAPVIASSPASVTPVSAGPLFMDNFNRADANLTAPWTKPYTPASQLYWQDTYSNACRIGASGAGQENAFIVASSFAPTANVKVSAKYTRCDLNFYSYLVGRMTNSATSTGYAIEVKTSQIRLVKFTGAGTLTPIGAAIAHTWVSGDVFAISCVGNTIKAFINGAEVDSVTDTSYQSAAYAGFYAKSFTGSTAIHIFDDFKVEAAS